MRTEIRKEFDSLLAPVHRYIGDSEVKTFSSKVQDFDKYRNSVVQKMKETPGLSIQDAYTLVSHADKLKSVNQASSNAQNREKLKNTPIAGRQPSASGSAKKDPESLSDAIWEAMKENRRPV